MALKLTETLDNGIIADYWKITDCNVVTGQVCMALFKDQEYASNRRNMLEGRISFNIDFDLKKLEELDMNPIKYAYNKIKESNIIDKVETNKWALAEDC